MGGSGGGPPRKSHTKSRKGCRTCKKRHIRCSEEFPQCKNCTKHSVRCDYMDMTNAGDEPTKGSGPPDLLTSQDLQHVLDNWRLTGEPPIPELRVSDTNYWPRFSTIDLRLIYNITTLYTDMYRRGYSVCTVWAAKMANLISAALSSDFTMNALLAFSASHLAWQTKNVDTENLAFHHSGVALRGLHEAIGAFSEQNSEAVLATSILLLWQATEWRTWASLQQGVSTVINAMRPWIHKSELASFLDSQRKLARVRAPQTPSVSGLPPQPTTPEDIARMQQLHTALQTLRLRLINHPRLVQYVDELMDYMQQIQQEYPYPSPEQTFDKLLYLRSAIFWLPSSILKPHESDLGALAVLSHYFALGLVLEPLMPEVAGAYLGNISLSPVEKMHEMLVLRRSNMPHDTSVDVALSLIETPHQIATSYLAARQPMLVIDPSQYNFPRPPQPQSPIHDVYTPQPMVLPSPVEALRSNSYPSQTAQTSQHLSRQRSFVDQFAATSISGRKANSDVYSPNHGDHRAMMTSPTSTGTLAAHLGSMSPPNAPDYFPPYGYGGTYNAIPQLQTRVDPPRSPLLPGLPYSGIYNTVPPPPDPRQNIVGSSSYRHDSRRSS